MDLNKILDLAIERKASDIHLVSNYYPAVRIDGSLYQLTTLPLLTKENTEALMTSILNKDQKESLYANKELDLGYEYKDSRFRINIYYSRNTVSASFRLIPKHIIRIEDPIEFVFPFSKAIVTQRELHQDTHSWSMALRSSLREDPDVIFV